MSLKLRLIIYGCLTLVAAVVLIVSSLKSYSQSHSLVKSASQADGKVVRLVDGAKPSIHYAIYAFKDDQGHWHSVFTDLNDKPPHPSNLQVGDDVHLLYQPDHPEEAVPVSFKRLWQHAVWTGIAGGVVLLVGVGVLFVARTQ
ncbi:MAG TPA: DUF3592 domain-containing protein [Chthoniobacteraceae bacterium]|nr:DUF3592 domain-containing protein [Chthoniobacteraceae bacterium]